MVCGVINFNKITLAGLNVKQKSYKKKNRKLW